MNKHTAEPRGARTEQCFDKVLFNIDVLIIEFRQDFLIDIIPYPHHREFKKSRHRRWKRIDTIDIQENCAARQFIQNTLCTGNVHLPDLRRFFYIEPFDREQRDQIRFPITEEHLQDLVE